MLDRLPPWPYAAGTIVTNHNIKVGRRAPGRILRDTLSTSMALRHRPVMSFQEFRLPFTISGFWVVRFKYIVTFDSTSEESNGLPFAAGYCANGLTAVARQSVASAVGSTRWRSAFGLP